MISQYTWPNFRNGRDREAVQVLIEEQGYQGDIKYGKTKIFVRSPRTLFQLEQLRSQLIPGIVIFLQKVWRGTLARMRYRRMKAALTIIKHYRKYKMRAYIILLLKVFHNVKNSNDYGKNIEFPKPPHVLKGIVGDIKKIFNTWRACMILRKIPREEWPQLRVKLAAAEAIKGRRPQLGLARKWEGNYLAQSAENQNTSLFISSVNSLKTKDKFSKVLYSSFIKKVNRHYKSADRVLLVTDKYFYKLDCKKFQSMKSSTPFTDIIGLSLSPGVDQLVIIHLRGGNDFVFCLLPITENRAPELVGTLCKQWHEKHNQELRLNVGPQFQCMLGGKGRTLNIESNTGVSFPTFKKNGQVITFQWP